MPVDVEHVAVTPRCAECLDVWLPDDEERWRAYLDTDDELAVEGRRLVALGHRHLTEARGADHA